MEEQFSHSNCSVAEVVNTSARTWNVKRFERCLVGCCTVYVYLLPFTFLQDKNTRTSSGHFDALHPRGQFVCVGRRTEQQCEGDVGGFELLP